MYVVAIIGKNQSRLHTYTTEFCARKCDVTTCADDVIDYVMKIKNKTNHPISSNSHPSATAK